jgi:endonuclease G, mitochondrial
MPKKPSSKIPSALRRTKAFVVANIVLWGVIGGWYLFQPAARQAEVAQLTRNLFDERKQVTAFEFAWDLWQLYFSEDFVRGIAPGDKSFSYGGPPVGGGARTLVNTAYVAGYSEALGNPLWAAYRVSDTENNAGAPRPDHFAVDLRTITRVDPDIYNRSGYDRGHLAPNHAIALHYGRRAQEETFLMSNVIPQKHELNAGIWKTLEQKIASNYPARFGEVWVIAGPVFGKSPARLKRKVAVPDACFMIVIDESDGRVRAEAFLFPQDAGGELGGYLTTIDEIERRTGLDFLAELSDDAENALEAKQVERAW